MHVGSCNLRLDRASVYSFARLPGVVISAEEMKRDVGLVSDDPAVVWIGGNVKELTSVKRNYSAVVERGRGGPGENQPDVLHVTTRRA